MPRVSQSREKTAVLLDFGGVLVLPSVEPVRSALAGLDERLPDEVLERAFYSGIAAIDRRGPFASEEESTETMSMDSSPNLAGRAQNQLLGVQ